MASNNLFALISITVVLAVIVQLAYSQGNNACSGGGCGGGGGGGQCTPKSICGGQQKAGSMYPKLYNNGCKQNSQSCKNCGSGGGKGYYQAVCTGYKNCGSIYSYQKYCQGGSACIDCGGNNVYWKCMSKYMSPSQWNMYASKMGCN